MSCLKLEFVWKMAKSKKRISKSIEEQLWEATDKLRKY